jgi:hypothetical protein
MSYNITNYDGSALVTVQDGTLDTTSTSITLLGKNSVNFGLAMNENFVHLMQNFSGSIQPANPLPGQLWYNSVTKVLSFYNGKGWPTLAPPFDGQAGTATYTIPNIVPTVDVTLTFSSGVIVSATSSIAVPPSSLPAQISIGGTNVTFQSLFPTGLFPGITLASSVSVNNQFVGTATKANVLATARTISLNGSINGNVIFDGSQNVTISSNLITALAGNVVTNAISNGLTLPSWFTNVYVSSNGIVTDATAIAPNDIYNALGYTPPSLIQISGDVTGNTVANGTVWTANVYINNTTVTPGYYSNVYVGANGLVTAANNDNAVPTTGMILWPSTSPVPAGWTLCNGAVVTLPNGSTFTPPNIEGSAPTGTVYIARIV